MQDEAAPTRPRVWMDGFGLSIAQGTGIATYARNLAATLQGAGFETGLLYGRPMPWGGDATGREIAFFDAQARMRPWWRHAIEQAWPQRQAWNPKREVVMPSV